jgi:hypothetical protein
MKDESVNSGVENSNSFNLKTELKTATKWLLATLVLMWVLTILYFHSNQMSPWQTLQLLPNMTFQFAKTAMFWFYLLLPYGLFIWLRFLVRSFKNQGQTAFFKKLLLTTTLPLFAFFIISKIVEISNAEVDWKSEIAQRDFQVYNHFEKDKKLRGVHFVPARNPETKHFLSLVKNNIEWIALTTFAWQQTPESDSIKMPPLNEFGWSKKDSSIFKTVKFAKKHGIRTFLQPKILIENSKNTATQDIHFENDTLWQNWSTDYQNFILQQANIAQKSGVDVFCMGTELSQLTMAHPDFFENLIDSIQLIYQGKITYAADWQTEFTALPFWTKLDYIGIQAGFSLTDNKKPSIATLKEAWQPHFYKIKTLQQQVDRPVFFTEIGYKSTEDAAFEPRQKAGGLAGMFQKVSTRTQANCYHAFFESFWQKSWFAGAFFVDWRANYERAGGRDSPGFSPQNKEAEVILGKWFD